MKEDIYFLLFVINKRIVPYSLPDKVPTPITRSSHIVSNVMAGPRTAIPSAILLWTSSWDLDFRAYLARTQALERSTNNKKNGKASLKKKILFDLVSSDCIHVFYSAAF